PLVETGDMMKLALPDDSLDLLYTNCVDHSFDLDAMIGEHARVLKPNGYLLYDIAFNEDEGAGVWESILWEREEDVIRRLLEKFRELVRVERERGWIWVLVRGKR
ncbi:MAG: methyltransferase domain-containing protein, partial [Chthoniobacterales bacterium]